MHVYTLQFISRSDDYKRRESTWETSRVEVFSDANKAYNAACEYLAEELLFESGKLDYYDQDEDDDVPIDKGTIEEYFIKKFPDYCEEIIVGYVLSCGGTFKDPEHAYDIVQNLVPIGEYVDAFILEAKVERQKVL